MQAVLCFAGFDPITYGSAIINRVAYRADKTEEQNILLKSPVKEGISMNRDKTNVMRVLEQKKIPYLAHQYPHQEGEAVDGATVARLLGQDPAAVFKTLVTKGASGEHYVFVLPVLSELDLKKAARAAGEKSVEMIPVKAITPLTGYVRGGCSPIGMKKRLKTVLDVSARELIQMVVSAGKIGFQVELAPGDLAKAVGAGYADLVKE